METPRPSPPSGDEPESAFRMIDVGGKTPTRRRAVACGRIRMARATLARIREKSMPKGDVLALAEVAGIMAAKRTPDILPLCHPLLLDTVRVRCEFDGEETVLVSCEVVTTAKTGVEMEALTGASAALLSIYDLTKGIDPALTISDVHLRLKEGGKSGVWRHPSPPPGLAVEPVAAPAVSLAGVKAGVVTVSDRCSRGEAQDGSGPAIAGFLRDRGAEVVDGALVPDERAAIQAAVRRLLAESKADLVITTGGTGLGPRDVTPEALREVFTRPVPGIGELLRAEGARKTSRSWLSRCEAGLVGQALVVLLPGSPRAVLDGMETLEPILEHAIRMARGEGHESNGGSHGAAGAAGRRDGP